MASESPASRAMKTGFNQQQPALSWEPVHDNRGRIAAIRFERNFDEIREVSIIDMRTIVQWTSQLAPQTDNTVSPVSLPLSQSEGDALIQQLTATLDTEASRTSVAPVIVHWKAVRKLAAGYETKQMGLAVLSDPTLQRNVNIDFAGNQIGETTRNHFKVGDNVYVVEHMFGVIRSIEIRENAGTYNQIAAIVTRQGRALQRSFDGSTQYLRRMETSEADEAVVSLITNIASQFPAIAENVETFRGQAIVQLDKNNRLAAEEAERDDGDSYFDWKPTPFSVDPDAYLDSGSQNRAFSALATTRMTGNGTSTTEQRVGFV